MSMERCTIYPTIRFSSKLTKAADDIFQASTFARKGALIWHVADIKNGQIGRLTECRPYTDAKGNRILLPVNDMGSPLAFYRKADVGRELDNEKKRFAYIILCDKKYSLNAIPCKSKKGPNTKIYSVTHDNTGTATALENNGPFQMRIAPFNSHYYGAEKAADVYLAGDIILARDGTIIKITDKSGGYHLKPTDPDYDAKLALQKELLFSLGIPEEAFEKFVELENVTKIPRPPLSLEAVKEQWRSVSPFSSPLTIKTLETLSPSPLALSRTLQTADSPTPSSHSQRFFPLINKEEKKAQSNLSIPTDGRIVSLVKGLK